MRKRLTKRTWIAAALGFAVTIGLVAFGTSLLAADPEDIEEEKVEVYPETKTITAPTLLPEPPRVPRPAETAAVSIESARQQLRSQDKINAVIGAGLAGDADSIIELAKKGNFCERQLRTPPPECKDTKVHPGVYFQGALIEPVLMPAESMTVWIGEILANGPVDLTLVARESGGGRYYLVFKASKPANIDGNHFDSIGIVVDPDEEQAIQWFQFIIPEDNGVEWLQGITQATGQRFDLVAPKSVKDWPGLYNEKGD